MSLKRCYLDPWNPDQYDPINSGSGDPHTVFHYDPVGRVIQTDNPDGTKSKVVYSKWKVTTLDEIGAENGGYTEAAWDKLIIATGSVPLALPAIPFDGNKNSGSPRAPSLFIVGFSLINPLLAAGSTKLRSTPGHKSPSSSESVPTYKSISMGPANVAVKNMGKNIISKNLLKCIICYEW